MSKYSSQGVEIKEGGNSKWLEAGSVQVARFTSFDFITSKGNTPGVKVTFNGPPTDTLPEGQKLEETWWLSDAAYTYTRDRFILAADKLGLREKLDAITASVDSDKAYVDAIAQVFKNAKIALAIGGEQVWMLDETTNEYNAWIKPSLISYGWCGNPDSPEDMEKLNQRIEKLRSTEKLIKTNPKPEPVAPQEGDASNDW